MNLATLAEQLKTDREMTKEYLQKNYKDENIIKGYFLAALAINYFRQ
jgi:hypothetical protein